MKLLSAWPTSKKAICNFPAALWGAAVAAAGGAADAAGVAAGTAVSGGAAQPEKSSIAASRMEHKVRFLTVTIHHLEALIKV